MHMHDHSLRWQPLQNRSYEGSQVVQTFSYFMPDFNSPLQVGQHFFWFSAGEAFSGVKLVLLDAAIVTSRLLRICLESAAEEVFQKHTTTVATNSNHNDARRNTHQT